MMWIVFKYVYVDESVVIWNKIASFMIILAVLMKFRANSAQRFNSSQFYAMI